PVQFVQCTAALHFFIGIKFQSMEMKKNYGVLCTTTFIQNKQFIVFLCWQILLDIPGSQPAPRVLQYMHTGESFRPVIQVFLVSEFSVFQIGKAPFQAAVPPPSKGG